jgi:hypothetical protein
MTKRNSPIRNHRKFYENLSETTRPPPRRLAGGHNMMTERKFREQEVQIARYRILEREVTDPLAASLLHIIILELEADLQKDWKIGQRNCQGN